MAQDVSTSDVALWPKRSAMQRINSRSLPQETPSPSATAASLPGLLSPSSARPDSPKTLTSTMSSVVEVLPPLEVRETCGKKWGEIHRVDVKLSKYLSIEVCK
jgi:hypothetical protein